MTLPLLLSVPHAGLEVPDWLAAKCLLGHEDIMRDGDEGAASIYALRDEVEQFQTTAVARAILDMNRPEDDRRRDGVVKTHTCWDVPIYREPLTDAEIERLLAEHHRPYHRALTARAGDVLLGVDCHTMATHGPPVGPDPGAPRPAVCIGDGDGALPRPWAELLRDCFAARFAGEVTLNEPFGGGYITRFHGREMPWVQIELARSEHPPLRDKRTTVLEALREFCEHPPPPIPRPAV